MCGIAGIIGFNLDQETAAAPCQAMLRALQHRGPDASGISHDFHGQAHLIHTRLSIIDLSDYANQPLHRGERYRIVFNGEIYNHVILRKRLEAKGAIFQTNSDTEVILALYEYEGSSAFQQLRGMYSFAIWDQKEKVCLLVRDPFGIKPLYYSVQPEGIIFASEVKAIFSSGLAQAKLSPHGVASYLRWGSADQSVSLLETVECVAPGTHIKFQHGKLHKTLFQSIPSEPESARHSVADFRSAFLDSVSAHLTSDVPVGLFLSGGLDSTALLTACQILGKSDTPLFTLCFPGTSTDESINTQQVAAHFQKELHLETPTAEQLPELFSDFLTTQDFPSIDGFNTYCISRAAAKQGMKVILSGLGGDELLGGYPSFQRIPHWTTFGKFYSKIPAHKYIANLLSTFSGNKSARLSEFLKGPPTPYRAYAACRSLFTYSEIKVILRDLDLPETSSDCENGMMSASPIQISHCEATHYMRNQLLRDADACSMRHGLELRVPFVDLPLWKTCAALPASIRYEKGKKILQHALPEMPPWLFDQPKKGFSLPYQQWRQSELKSFFANNPLKHLSYSPTWYQEMALLSLKQWRKNFGV